MQVNQKRVMFSFTCGATDVPGMAKGETYRATEIHAPKVPRKEHNFTTLSASQEVGSGTKRLKVTRTPPEPSLWSNSSFDTVAFYDHLISFPMNLLSDYHTLFALSTTQLSTLLEIKLMRCFLVERFLRKKHSDTLARMMFEVANLNRRTRKGTVALNKYKVRIVDRKVFSKGVVAEMRVQWEEVAGLQKLLEETQSALESKKERISQIADDGVVDFVHLF
ncbi:unnamed protein product [Vicia faba]|uniref:Uncharacterized protein n=1 Tax=Vicia faba TaxID=3906 RepID=A0AAV0Z567_VICFA|nr:unnamed protein product [Vicia faba]